MTTRKKHPASTTRVSAAFLELWRNAMRGDAEALDALLPEALKLDPADARAGAARRMVLRALQQASRQLQARAESSPEPEASRLREAARRRFYQAVLARHVNLQAAASTASLFAPEPPPVTAKPIAAAVADLAGHGAEAAAVEPECLLDPPPDAPGEMMAANVPLLPLGGGAVGSTGVKLHWEIPDNHGKDITSYTVSVQPKPLACTIQYSANSAVVKGLLAGTYTFQVIATNGDGPSVPSAPSNPVSVADLPAAKVPAVRARTSGTLVAVEWDAPAAPAVTEYWLVVYDAATPGRVVARKRVSGQSLSTAFSGLPKGSYTFSVRAFAKGGFGDEALSTALAYTPAPTPFDAATKPFSADSLLHFNLGNSGLKPDDLVKRLTGAMGTAGKWRFDYLKSLAIQSVNNTVAYEQQIAQLMQMAVSKVSTAQMLLSPVLQQVLTTIKGEVQDLKSLATSDTVQGIVKQVGEAAATATSLEGLITFLMDKSPFDFWVGLFEGLMCDIACFDTGMNRTEAFLQDYFNKLGEELKEYIRGLVIRVEQTIDALAGPLRAAIADIVSGTSKALGDTMKAFGDPPLLQAVAPGNGELLPGGNPFAPVESVLKNLDQTLTDVIQLIKDTIKTTLENALDGEGLLIKLVKAFIVYPILGILVISFAGGFIAAGVIAAVVLALGIELLRVVARWLAGPLLDVLADAKQKVVDTLNQFKGVFEKQLALLDNPADNLQLVSGSLAELRALLPQAFLTEAAALLGDARRALLQNTSSLALAAERALGLEHCTAFDVVTGTYKRQVAAAPQLPGGSDDTFLGGAAMLRDLNLLETQRTRLTDGKEVVMTQRLSLFRLLGGVGDPAAAAGEVQKAMNELLSGGRIIVKLSEELLIDRGFPGLYRVLIDDIQPRGVIGAAFSKAQHLLPMSIPLTLTHLGPARTRIRREGNLAAPPLELSRILQQDPKVLIPNLFSAGGPSGASSLQTVVEGVVDAALATLGNFTFGPARVRLNGYMSAHSFNAAAPTDWHDYMYISTNAEVQRLLGNNAKGYGDTGGERFQGLAAPTLQNPAPGAVPVFCKVRKADRLSDGWADHFYTLVESEAQQDYDSLGKVFWAFPPGYGAIPGLVTLNRYRNLNHPGHLLSETQPQKDGKDDPDWAIDGPLFSAYKAYSSGVAFTDVLPAAASILAQLRAALMANLPLAVAAWLSQVTDGLVPQAASAGTVRGITQWIFDSIDSTKGGKGKPLTECVFDTKAGTTVCPTRAVTRAEILALLNGATLANGIVPDATKTPLLPGLANLVVIEHAAQLSAQSLSIAKWAGSTITEDRDPHIRSLGFVTLVGSPGTELEFAL